MIDPISGLTAGLLIDPFVDSRTEVPLVFVPEDAHTLPVDLGVEQVLGVTWIESSVIELTLKQEGLELFYPNDEERRVLRKSLEASSERLSEGFLAE